MDENEDWQRIIDGFRTGDNAIIQEFWERYGPSLHRIADRQLADRLKRRVGPEDVVQSVCRTFFRRLQTGQLQLTDSESLWRLLCAITLTKVREKARFHQRKRRGMDREVHAMPGSDASSAEAFPMVSSEPSPEEALEFGEQFQKLLDVLDDEEKQIVDLKLQELTHDEVAERMGISERTVRRLFKRIQQKLGRVFDLPSE